MARMRIVAESTPAKARVIEVEQIENPQDEYEKLRQLSAIPVNQLFDRYEIQMRLDDASTSGHRARVLYLHALRMFERFERSVRPELASIRDLALRRLTEKQRLQNTSKRKIMTERDVEDYVHLDNQLRERFNVVTEQLEDGRQAVAVLESLATAWKERVHILQTMASALPKVHKDE